MNVEKSSQRPILLISLWIICLGIVLVAPGVFALSDPGDFLIRNTIRLALTYWVLAVALILTGSSMGSSARLAWTLACITYLVHVAMAFEYAHHWSHTEAFEHVRQVGGFGEGIFINYAFTLLWTVDCLWWWLDRAGYEQRPRWFGWSIHGFMVFMIVNGAIIFESGPIRWVSLAVLLGLGWLLWDVLTD